MGNAKRGSLDSYLQRHKPAPELSSFGQWFAQLTHGEAIAWALGCKYSDIVRTVVWEYSDRDLRTAIKVRFGEKSAEQAQGKENLFKIAEAIFGGGKSSGKEPGSLAEAEAMLKGM